MLMKPVQQTQFGKPLGNCWQAAIAAILEVDLEDVPAPVKSWPQTWDAVIDWLNARGLSIFSASVDLDHADFRWPSGVYIVLGDAVRGLRHAVVYRDGELAHDPYPGGTGLTKPKEIELIHPIDPAS